MSDTNGMTNSAVEAVNTSNAVATNTGIKSVITAGVTAATAALGGNLPAVEQAFTEFGNAATAAAEAAVSSTGGPIAAIAADALLPEIIGGLTKALEGLFVHIGAAIPEEIGKAQAWVDGKLGLNDPSPASNS